MDLMLIPGSESLDVENKSQNLSMNIDANDQMTNLLIMAKKNLKTEESSFDEDEMHDKILELGEEDNKEIEQKTMEIKISRLKLKLNR